MGVTSIVLEQKKDKPYNFVCKNERGGEIELTATHDIGGEGDFFKPMENLLNSIAGCSAIDVVNILRKQKEEITSLKFQVDGTRSQQDQATVFSAVDIKIFINKGINENKLQRAIELTRDKYCSVLLTIRPDCKITYTYEFV